MKKTKLLILALAAVCALCVLAGCGNTPSDTSDENLDNSPKLFDIDDVFFTFEGYDVVTVGPTETGENFAIFTKNTLEIYSTCLSSLDEVSATINLYDEKGKRVGTYRASQKGEIAAETTFVLSAEISDSVRDSFCVVAVEYSGITDTRDVYRVESFTYNITYVYNNGSPSEMVLVDWHTYLEPPELPQKDGYYFNGWYTDPECTERFDFETTMVSGDTVLYAGYGLDYMRMGQLVLAAARPSTVKITTKSYTRLAGLIEITSHTQTGEGIIIKDGSGYYYVLTTDDLVTKRKGYEDVSYTVEDYYGNTYHAHYKHSSDGYNLGVLYFEKGEQVLSTIPISHVSPEVSDKIAIANYSDDGTSIPNFGNVLAYEHITHSVIGSEAGDIRLDMMVHDAVTDIKISGRPVFNMSLELVGIQCGTLSDIAVDYENSHVIPLEAIEKYIAAYGL